MKLDLEPVNDPAAWKANDFKSADDFSVTLTPAEHDEVEKRIGELTARGLKWDQTSRKDFDFPILGPRLVQALDEIKSGRGFVLMRNIPVHEDKDRVRMAMWGIGTWFGTAVSQDAEGDLMCDVMDVSGGQPTPRGFRHSREQLLHTDLAADVMSLGCIQEAVEGGNSRTSSLVTVFNEMAKTRPDLLAVLSEGFYLFRMGEGRDDDPGITEYKVPFLIKYQGKVSGRPVRHAASAAAITRQEPLTEKQTEALNMFEAIGNAPENRLEFRMARGEMWIANNFNAMHGRAGFTNSNNPVEHRHLLRLWLDAGEDFRAIPKEINFYNRGKPGIPPAKGRTATFDMTKIYDTLAKERTPAK